MKFFEGDGSEKDLVLKKMRKNIGNLSKASLEFLEYLSSDYGKELLQKNKLKIYATIYAINFMIMYNTSKNFYNFFNDQEDEAKKFVNLNLNLGVDLEYYIKEILSGTTDDRFELRKNATAKFLFHRFNNFRQWFGFSKFQLRPSQISEDDYALKALQNKNWAYVIKTRLEVSTKQVDISSFSNPDEISILSQLSENLHIFKEHYHSIYHAVAGCFQEYLMRLPNLFVEKMEDDININLFSNIELKNEQDRAENFKTFNPFFYKFGRFSAVEKLAVIPRRSVPSFVKTDAILSLFEFFKFFSFLKK